MGIFLSGSVYVTNTPRIVAVYVIVEILDVTSTVHHCFIPRLFLETKHELESYLLSPILSAVFRYAGSFPSLDPTAVSHQGPESDQLSATPYITFK